VTCQVDFTKVREHIEQGLTSKTLSYPLRLQGIGGSNLTAQQLKSVKARLRSSSFTGSPHGVRAAQIFQVV
jgi:hypothetical protein